MTMVNVSMPVLGAIISRTVLMDQTRPTAVSRLLQLKDHALLIIKGRSKLGRQISCMLSSFFLSFLNHYALVSQANWCYMTFLQLVNSSCLIHALE